MPQTITQNALFGEASLEFAQGWKATMGLRGYHYQYTQSNSEWGDFTPYGFANLLSGASDTCRQHCSVQHDVLGQREWRQPEV